VGEAHRLVFQHGSSGRRLLHERGTLLRHLIQLMHRDADLKHAFAFF
jgi:hypothetical protein